MLRIPMMPGLAFVSEKPLILVLSSVLTQHFIIIKKVRHSRYHTPCLEYSRDGCFSGNVSSKGPFPSRNCNFGCTISCYWFCILLAIICAISYELTYLGWNGMSCTYKCPVRYSTTVSADVVIHGICVTVKYLV